MKKFLTALMALFSIVALAACSNNSSSSKSSSKDKTEKSTKMADSEESSSKSTKKSSSTDEEEVDTEESDEETSSSSSSSRKSSTSTTKVEILSDAEIDSVRTIGDFKNAYNKIVDGYSKYADEIGNKLPSSQRAAYNQQIDEMKKVLEESKQTVASNLAKGGSDSTEIPAEGRSTLINSLKLARDQAESTLQSVMDMLN